MIRIKSLFIRISNLRGSKVIEFRKLTTNDGKDIFEMVQEIGKGENSFTNSLYSGDFSLFYNPYTTNSQLV